VSSCYISYIPIARSTRPGKTAPAPRSRGRCTPRIRSRMEFPASMYQPQPLT